jgi:hypothetical protein
MLLPDVGLSTLNKKTKYKLSNLICSNLIVSNVTVPAITLHYKVTDTDNKKIMTN